MNESLGEIEPNVQQLTSSDTFPAGDSPSRSGEWISSLLIKRHLDVPLSSPSEQ